MNSSITTTTTTRTAIMIIIIVPKTGPCHLSLLLLYILSLTIAVLLPSITTTRIRLVSSWTIPTTPTPTTTITKIRVVGIPTTRIVRRNDRGVGNQIVIHQNRCKNYHYRSTMSSSSSSALASTSTTESYMQVLSKAVSEALGMTVELELATTGSSAGGTGGSGATTLVVQDKLSLRNQKYFVKSTSNRISHQQMMYGEFCSVQAIDQTRTIRVPKPIAYGNDESGSRTFVIFEYLSFAAPSQSQYTLGQELAQLHLQSIRSNPNPSSSQLYGFHVHNTIGATFQPNLPWYDNWTDFYINLRLNHMLQLTNNVGMSADDIDALRTKVREVLQQHTTVQPSLVHGDLWGGNKGFCYNDTISSSSSESSNSDETTKSQKHGVVVPCIFDPASYYGDREVDIAMTYVFGGFTTDFYRGYDSIFPLASGHESRRIIYNLYHILNHDVLFGGGYRNQARNMIYEILRM
jgi:fructosamine-3-kinase